MKGLIIVSFFALASCASVMVNNEIDKLGIPNEFRQDVFNHYENFNDMMAKARVVTNSFGFGGPSVSFASSGGVVDQQVQQIFCKCVNELGEKCIGANNKGDLWKKGVGAYLALKKYETHLEDPDMCPSKK